MNAVANTDTGAENRIGTGDGSDVAASEQPPELSKDELFHLLQNQRRRRVLLYLQDTEGEINMRDIAEQVAAWENDTTIEALGSNERQRVYIALYQSHLPKLDEAGVLTYNQQRGIVTRTELANQLDAYLNVEPLARKDAPATTAPTDTDEHPETDSSPTPDTQWNSTRFLRYYGGATVGSVLLIIASVTDIIALSGGALATVVTALFVAVTVGLTAKQ